MFGDKLYLYNLFTNFFKKMPQPVKHPNQESLIAFDFVKNLRNLKLFSS